MLRILLALTFFVFYSNVGFGGNDFHPKSYWISFAADASPFLMYITDSQNRRAGANPALTLDQYGRQLSEFSGLEEIPNSVTDQDNETNPITGKPHKTTLWSVTIPDSGVQNYVINLKGIRNGWDTVVITSGSQLKPGLGSSRGFLMFASAGIVKKLSVSFDPTRLNSSESFSVQRIIEKDGLLNDVKTAGQLNLISPSGIRQSLQAKASSIAKDVQNNDIKSEVQHIQVFLQELQVTDKDHIREPAFTILQEEANALLQNIQ